MLAERSRRHGQHRDEERVEGEPREGHGQRGPRVDVVLPGDRVGNQVGRIDEEPAGEGQRGAEHPGEWDEHERRAEQDQQIQDRRPAIGLRRGGAAARSPRRGTAMSRVSVVAIRYAPSHQPPPRGPRRAGRDGIAGTAGGRGRRAPRLHSRPTGSTSERPPASGRGSSPAAPRTAPRHSPSLRVKACR